VHPAVTLPKLESVLIANRFLSHAFLCFALTAAPIMAQATTTAIHLESGQMLNTTLEGSYDVQ
jgi:hypothetical protein